MNKKKPKNIPSKLECKFFALCRFKFMWLSVAHWSLVNLIFMSPRCDVCFSIFHRHIRVVLIENAHFYCNVSYQFADIQVFNFQLSVKKNDLDIHCIMILINLWLLHLKLLWKMREIKGKNSIVSNYTNECNGIPSNRIQI